MIKYNENFNWNEFLQPYGLAVEGFILKIEGIKKQYHMKKLYCPIEIVSGRVKSPKSIIDKAIRMNVPFDYIDERLYDIGGIRITCKYIEDVYLVAEMIKNRHDITLLEVRDYIKNVKPSGYRSLHLITEYHVETIDGSKAIRLEFQIRTHSMHFWASIEHSLKYKYQKQIPLEIKERLYRASEASARLDNEMSSIKAMMDELESLGVGNNSIDDSLEDEVTINNFKRW